jgi:hydroxymethylglutaryl-CoA lyase
MVEAGQLAERVVGHPLPGKLKSGGNLAKYRTRAQSG